MVEPVLQIKQLSCEREDRILFSGLEHSFLPATITQLEGPNGAGKTTLLRILAGLFTSYDGVVNWQGEALYKSQLSFQSQLLFIGHKSAIKTSMTPLENLRYLLGLRQTVVEEQLWSALSSVGLEGYEHVLCRNMSAGQQRRVTLAQLYLSEAKIWILDEIFTAIDKQGVAQFENLLLEKAISGVTIILTTHHQLSLPGLEILPIKGSVI
jgi:heme exporter protein A